MYINRHKHLSINSVVARDGPYLHWTIFHKNWKPENFPSERKLKSFLRMLAPLVYVAFYSKVSPCQPIGINGNVPRFSFWNKFIFLFEINERDNFWFRHQTFKFTRGVTSFEMTGVAFTLKYFFLQKSAQTFAQLNVLSNVNLSGNRALFQNRLWSVGLLVCWTIDPSILISFKSVWLFLSWISYSYFGHLLRQFWLKEIVDEPDCSVKSETFTAFLKFIFCSVSQKLVFLFFQNAFFGLTL